MAKRTNKRRYRKISFKKLLFGVLFIALVALVLSVLPKGNSRKNNSSTSAVVDKATEESTAAPIIESTASPAEGAAPSDAVDAFSDVTSEPLSVTQDASTTESVPDQTEAPIETEMPIQEANIIAESKIEETAAPIEETALPTEEAVPTEEVVAPAEEIIMPAEEVREEVVAEKNIVEQYMEEVTSGNYNLVQDDYQIVYFNDAPDLKGRGLVDIPGLEPEYVGAKGYAAVYTSAGLEKDESCLNTPWAVPIYCKTENGWAQVGTIDHKTRICIISQYLTKENGREYQGYLGFENLDNGNRAYINVVNFVTTSYWDMPVQKAAERGYGLAEYSQKSKYAPVLQTGNYASVKSGTKVLILARGTYYISIMNKIDYHVLGIVFERRGNKVTPQYVFFNKEDLNLIY